MESILCKHWHHCHAEDVAELLNVDAARGLSAFEAKHRLDRFGPNAVTAKKQKGLLQSFLLQFHQPLVYILLAAGVITLFLEEWVDASVILAVVLVNAVIGFIQESKAERAIESLKKMMSTRTTVLRDGKWISLDATELVVGDIVQMQSGDKVPADLRLLRSRDLQIDESALTGESVPVMKKDDILERDTVLADRRNMAYAGTLVTYGQGQAIVVATGDKTETGRISALIAAAEDLSTPLTKKIASFSEVLLYVILALAAATFAMGLWRGESPFQMFMAAVALVVSAIPEGLPAAVTITLAIGVKRMAAKKAIVRKLPAVETLGSTTVICSDKTGTLTENQMTVRKIYAGSGEYEVHGGGYAPEGGFLREGVPIGAVLPKALEECLLGGLLCNDSRLIQSDGSWRVEGDPTEGALITVARKAGFTPDRVFMERPRIDHIPFESERQFMATLHHPEGVSGGIIYLKGAVEKMIAACEQRMDDAGGVVGIDRQALLAKAEALAGEGMRVLAVACKAHGYERDRLEIEDCLAGLTFLGLQGMIDPPRQEAVAAVAKCHGAGIAVKMITGDHAVTAAVIARQLRIGADGDDWPMALTGSELNRMSDEDLIETANKASVFARVAPEQKLRLVEALQAKRHIVAMTGDGVNDAPALKQADIGIAMGITGTDVSKEAADMVLTDDNFATITQAVEEGRRIFDNLVKFITWTLPTNGGEGLVIIAAIATGVTLPILPVHVLWINMTTAILLGLMLAFEPGESDAMQHPPRGPDSPILTGVLLMRIVLVSVLMMAAVFSVFLWQKQQGYPLEVARTTAVNLFIMIETAYLYNCRSLTKSVLRIGLFSNPWTIIGSAAMLGLQLLFTYAPIMNRAFHTAPIALTDWIVVALVSFGVYLIVGMEKGLRYSMLARSGRRTA